MKKFLGLLLIFFGLAIGFMSGNSKGVLIGVMTTFVGLITTWSAEKR